MLESGSNRLRDLALQGAKFISISNYYAIKLVDVKLEFNFDRQILSKKITQQSTYHLWSQVSGPKSKNLWLDLELYLKTYYGLTLVYEG